VLWGINKLAPGWPKRGRSPGVLDGSNGGHVLVMVVVVVGRGGTCHKGVTCRRFNCGCSIWQLAGTYNYLFTITIKSLLLKITDTIKIYYKPHQILFWSIPVAIPVWSFLWPFRQNGNSGLNSSGMEIATLAGTTAKNPFHWNDRNGPDSTRFQ
jgi:hypothetical protein